MTTRQKIKEIRGRVTKTIPAPEIGEGETITVRRPSAGERRDMMRKFFDGQKCKPGMEADLQIHIVKNFCVDDETGERLFDDKDKLEESLDSQLTDRINEAFLELAKRDNVDPDKLEGNSEATQT